MQYINCIAIDDTYYHRACTCTRSAFEFGLKIVGILVDCPVCAIRVFTGVSVSMCAGGGGDGNGGGGGDGKGKGDKSDKDDKPGIKCWIAYLRM